MAVAGVRAPQKMLQRLKDRIKNLSDILDYRQGAPVSRQIAYSSL